MGIEEPLNLHELLVTTIAGSIELFTFIALIIVAAMSAKFQMPKSIFMVMLLFFGIIMAEWIGGLYLIIIILASFAIFSGIGKLVN